MEGNGEARDHHPASLESPPPTKSKSSSNGMEPAGEERRVEAREREVEEEMEGARGVGGTKAGSGKGKKRSAVGDENGGGKRQISSVSPEALRHVIIDG